MLSTKMLNKRYYIHSIYIITNIRLNLFYAIKYLYDIQRLVNPLIIYDN